MRAGLEKPLVVEPFGRRDEVVEHVLLAAEHARLVPGFAVLATPAKICDGVDAALFEQDEVCRIERRRQVDVEAAIPGQQNRTVPVPRQILPVHEEHRDVGAVLRRVPDLRRLVLGGIRVHAALSKRSRVAGWRSRNDNSPTDGQRR